MALDKDAVKRRAIEIAGRLIDEGGAEALQMRAIARELGVSVGSVYNIVGDIDALHRLVNVDLLDELGMAGSETTERLRRDGVRDVRTRLIALAETYLDFVERNHVKWAALLAFNRSRPSVAMPESYMLRQEMLFDIIADVLADTPLRNDDTRRQTAARALWSAVHGIVTNNFVGRGDASLAVESRVQIDLLVTVFVRGLLVEI
ncbi:TetR/AcrR family transcriptional regulator [Oricola sp.]|uniref:TetR/AcrR family transcriptional regulator n=1 Tax=Oricola sp. TaxID=1979950 RepID=UPI0025FDF7E3|nr:TetR/AcrR family transcriptional regulator [Oricola sp.]MCI5078423.1 TetR/AcrR family transcriptional regulator [Oricola sp.]